MARGKRVEVVISVDDAHVPKLAEVASRLTQAGLDDPTMMDAIGAISGKTSEGKIPDLKKIPGVVAVERSQTVYPAKDA
jgi:hypothetical protein